MSNISAGIGVDQHLPYLSLICMEKGWKTLVQCGAIIPPEYALDIVLLTVSYKTSNIILEQQQMSPGYSFCGQGTRGFWKVWIIGEVSLFLLAKLLFSSLPSQPDIISGWMTKWLPDVIFEVSRGSCFGSSRRCLFQYKIAHKLLTTSQEMLSSERHCISLNNLVNLHSTQTLHQQWGESRTDLCRMILNT